MRVLNCVQMFTSYTCSCHKPIKKLTHRQDQTRSETEIQAKWCGGDCVKRCERHVFKGVRIKNRDGTAGKRARDV